MNDRDSGFELTEIAHFYEQAGVRGEQAPAFETTTVVEAFDASCVEGSLYVEFRPDIAAATHTTVVCDEFEVPAEFFTDSVLVSIEDLEGHMPWHLSEEAHRFLVSHKERGRQHAVP